MNPHLLYNNAFDGTAELRWGNLQTRLGPLSFSATAAAVTNISLAHTGGHTRIVSTPPAAPGHTTITETIFDPAGRDGRTPSAQQKHPQTGKNKAPRTIVREGGVHRDWYIGITGRHHTPCTTHLS